MSSGMRAHLVASVGAALILILLARRRRRQRLTRAVEVQAKIKPVVSQDKAAAPSVATVAASAAAAETIKGWAACMRGKLKTVGNGYQPAEVLLVQKRGGVLRIDDCGGWAQRNESMARLLRAADAASSTSDALADFAPLLVQTTDRCFAQRRVAATDGASRAATGTDTAVLSLHLWQNQPLPSWLLESLPPLTRVLSMCGAGRYADVPVPDWAFDSWPEAGVHPGQFDAACAELAAAGAATPTDARACWCGIPPPEPERWPEPKLAPRAQTWAPSPSPSPSPEPAPGPRPRYGTPYHHPSRLKLQRIAAEHPELLLVNGGGQGAAAARWDGGGGAVGSGGAAGGGGAADGGGAAGGGGAAQAMSLLEQVRTFGGLLDLQGKGYSARLKLLLHSGRPVLRHARVERVGGCWIAGGGLIDQAPPAIFLRAVRIACTPSCMPGASHAACALRAAPHTALRTIVGALWPYACPSRRLAAIAPRLCARTWVDRQTGRQAGRTWKRAA